MIESLLNLPDIADAALWIKIGLLAASALLACYFLMLTLLNTIYRNTGNPRDLDIALSRFWSLLWTLALLQVYWLLVLNWNLGDLGRESLLDYRFYIRFLPEILVSAAMLISLLAIRRDIRSALKQ